MSNVEKADLEIFAKQAFLAYAMSVVRGRAIPSVEDGLKPVQRRVLYAMNVLKITDTSKPMKCARVVGDVIGKYHPHGDSAVYEAMVRMAQKHQLRYPLVDGHGNFGSRDGDNAAAMRYTEARLTPIASALLDELSHDTVDYRPNYDNSMEEPVTLPARLPFLLLNGASGIGVGLATDLLPHNLGEVVEAAKLLLMKPKTKLDEFLACIPGPDFPTGGKLISSPDDIRKIYEEGNGTLRLRAQWRVEESGKRWKLIFHELPQPTNSEAVMKEIAELLDPKPREKVGKPSGKSSAPAKLVLSTEQMRLKKLFGDLIESFVDGSDDQTPIRLVVEPKDKKIKPDDLAMALCAHTSLEGNVKANFVCVDRTGTPRPGNIMDWLGQWCEYRVDTVRRRLTDQKARLDHRLHILAGRLSILDKIDEVIQVIKVSEDAKADLMSKYKLSEIQAEDVLEMRLRSLANLEKHKLEDEQKEKAQESDRLGKLLADDKAVRKLIMKELDADAKAFGDERRTELAPAEASNSKAASAPLALSERLGPEPMAVALTERGWLAWRPAKSLEEARIADFKIKGGDSIRRIYFGDRNSDCLVLLSEKGRGYSLRLAELSKADTDPLTKWFELDGRIMEGAIANNDTQFVLAGQEGYGFIVKGSSWINRMRAGKDLLVVGAGAPPLPPLPVPAGLPPETRLVALASDGRAVVFPLTDMKALAKGKGVAIMGLAQGVHLADIALVPQTAKLVLKSTKKDVALAPAHFDSYAGTRSAGKKGKNLDKLSAAAVFDRPGREGALDAPASE